MSSNLAADEWNSDGHVSFDEARNNSVDVVTALSKPPSVSSDYYDNAGFGGGVVGLTAVIRDTGGESHGGNMRNPLESLMVQQLLVHLQLGLDVDDDDQTLLDVVHVGEHSIVGDTCATDDDVQATAAGHSGIGNGVASFVGSDVLLQSQTTEFVDDPGQSLISLWDVDDDDFCVVSLELAGDSGTDVVGGISDSGNFAG